MMYTMATILSVVTGVLLAICIIYIVERIGQERYINPLKDIKILVTILVMLGIIIAELIYLPVQ